MFEAGAERIETLAKHSPLSRSAIYSAISDGTLVARKHGGITLILKDDWDTFLRSRPIAERRARTAATNAD